MFVLHSSTSQYSAEPAAVTHRRGFFYTRSSTGTSSYSGLQSSAHNVTQRMHACGVGVRVWVRMRERERERSKVTLTVRAEKQAKYQRKVDVQLAMLVAFASMLAGDLVGDGSCVLCVCVCVCVRERERERERVCVYRCVFVCPCNT
jgi:hypothetical protein